MYWIPGIFIFLEIIILFNLDTVIKKASSSELYKKYNDENLKKYISEKYGDISIIVGIFAFCIVFEYIYFIIGLFYSMWLISICFLVISVLLALINKKVPSQKYEKLIIIAELENFQASDLRFDRFLKLNEINFKSDKKLIRKVKFAKIYTYSTSILRIIILLSIIILHYHFKII